MKRLFCLMGGAMLLLNSYGQEIEPFYPGDRIPDLVLERVMNYKDNSIQLSTLDKKLIIFDFWSIHCAGCIEEFMKQEILQKSFENQLQFILVTFDSKEKVTAFLLNYKKKHNSALSLPIVYGDSVLYYLFRHHFIPHYAWVSADGKLLAQTDKKFINESTIEHTISAITYIEEEMKRSNFPRNMWQFPMLPAELENFIRQNKIN